MKEEENNTTSNSKTSGGSVKSGLLLLWKKLPIPVKLGTIGVILGFLALLFLIILIVAIFSLHKDSGIWDDKEEDFPAECQVVDISGTIKNKNIELTVGFETGLKLEKIKGKIKTEGNVKTFAAENNKNDFDKKIINGDTNEAKVWIFLIQHGFTPQAAAGVMGNIKQESGDFNPRKIEGGAIAPDGYTMKPNVGFGIVQWTYPSRQKNFAAHAKKIGKPITDLSAQLSFLIEEMKTYKALKNYKSMTNIQKAATIFHDSYENSDDYNRFGGIGHRIEAAKNMYKKYKDSIVFLKTKVTGSIIDKNITMSGKVGENEISASGTIKNNKITGKGIVGPSGKCGAYYGQIGAGILSWPTPTCTTITSRFGPRGGGFHGGLDIGCSIGTAIVASDSGKVTKAAYSGSYGNLVVVDHLNGTQTYYAHQVSGGIMVKVGQAVVRGQQIGKVGNTGRSTGPHLHFGVLVNGSFKNPENYISPPKK